MALGDGIMSFKLVTNAGLELAVIMPGTNVWFPTN
jgi:hypothetical protein